MTDETNGPKRTDLHRARDWLMGEVRVSRAYLGAGGLLFLALLVVALD